MTRTEIQARADAAGLFYRSQYRTPSRECVTLESAATHVGDLPDRDLAVIAGLSETTHYGFKVRRWPGSPDTVTVELFTD